MAASSFRQCSEVTSRPAPSVAKSKSIPGLSSGVSGQNDLPRGIVGVVSSIIGAEEIDYGLILLGQAPIQLRLNDLLDPRAPPSAPPLRRVVRRAPPWPIIGASSHH